MPFVQVFTQVHVFPFLRFLHQNTSALQQTDRQGKVFLAKQLSEGGLFSKEPPPLEIRSPRAKQADCQRIILFGKYEADIFWRNFE